MCIFSACRVQKEFEESGTFEASNGNSGGPLSTIPDDESAAMMTANRSSSSSADSADAGAASAVDGGSNESVTESKLRKISAAMGALNIDGGSAVGADFASSVHAADAFSPYFQRVSVSGDDNTGVSCKPTLQAR